MYYLYIACFQKGTNYLNNFLSILKYIIRIKIMPSLLPFALFILNGLNISNTPPSYNEELVDIQHKKAYVYYQSKKYEQAVELWKKAAQQGYAPAQYYLGWCYREGTGVKKDLKLAVDWYLKAANQGNIDAQLFLGEMYELGYEIRKDPKKAAFWYLLAAEQGDLRAQFNIADCYWTGFGVEKNVYLALFWYNKAAAQNNGATSRDALFHIGWIYQAGDGVKKDTKKAEEYFEKACKNGEVAIAFHLGMYYETGNWGFEKNTQKALYWYKKAVEQGSISAQKMLKRLEDKLK